MLDVVDQVKYIAVVCS